MGAHEQALREQAAAQAIEVERTRQLLAHEQLVHFRENADQHLTLRDHLALAAPLPPLDGLETGNLKVQIEAEWRYQWADAMLAARNAEKQST